MFSIHIFQTHFIKQRMTYLRIMTIAILAFVILACSKDDNDDDMSSCDTNDITYTNTVEAIFSASCDIPGCHANLSPHGAIDGYDNAVQFTMDKPILAALRHEAGVEPMPQALAKLDDCTIDKIEAWIANGTPE